MFYHKLHTSRLMQAKHPKGTSKGKSNFGSVNIYMYWENVYQNADVKKQTNCAVRLNNLFTI